jgi:hypothetical protein
MTNAKITEAAVFAVVAGFFFEELNWPAVKLYRSWVLLRRKEGNSID